MENERLDSIRKSALHEIDRSKNTAVKFLVAAGVFEGVVMIAILFLIDFSSETHLIIFLTGCLVYGTLAFGLFSLKAFVDMSTLRILQAVEIANLEK